MLQAFATMFWKQFVTEYIPSPTIYKKWNIPQRNFKSEDLVLVFDKNADQTKWELACIVKIKPEKDEL